MEDGSVVAPDCALPLLPPRFPLRLLIANNYQMTQEKNEFKGDLMKVWKEDTLLMETMIFGVLDDVSGIHVGICDVWWMR